MRKRACIVGPMRVAASDYYNHANTEAIANGENIFSKICSEAAYLRLLKYFVDVLLAYTPTSSASHSPAYLPSCVALNMHHSSFVS